MSAAPPWVPHISPSFGQRNSFGGQRYGSSPLAGRGLRSSASSPGRSNFGSSSFTGHPHSSAGSTSTPPRGLGGSMASQPGMYPENLAAAYETCRDEIRVLGRELREAQQEARATPDAEYWKGQAQKLHSQMQSLYNFAGNDELRMHSEMRHFQGLADGETIAARWKVAASEAEAQIIAHQTAETAIAGSEWRVRKDTEWLKTRLQAAEEQRSKLSGLTEHYKGLACKQLDTIQETNAQVAEHRAKIRDDEAKMQFLENSNGWLVQRLRTSEEEEAELAAFVPRVQEANDQVFARLSQTEGTLLEVEAREKDFVQNLEGKVKSLEDDADMLRGQVWDATNRAGLAEAEMGVMAEQTTALKKKYQGVEERRARLAMLEEANKQLRAKIDKFKDQEKLLDTLSQDNEKLKRRLKSSSYASSKSAAAAARSMDIENQELKSELLEVTKVLEQVGDTPAPHEDWRYARPPQEDWRYGSMHQSARDFSAQRRIQSASPEPFATVHAPSVEQIFSMSVPVASSSAIHSPNRSARSIASPKLSSREVSASPTRIIHSSHLQARSESPREMRETECDVNSSDARLFAAMQNVTRALARAGLDRGSTTSQAKQRAGTR